MRNPIVARTRKVPSYHFGPALFLQHTSSPAVDLMTPKDYFDAREGPVRAQPEPQSEQTKALAIEQAREERREADALMDAELRRQQQGEDQLNVFLDQMERTWSAAVIRLWIVRRERRQR